jgi:hypothetical protein
VIAGPTRGSIRTGAIDVINRLAQLGFGSDIARDSRRRTINWHVGLFGRRTVHSGSTASTVGSDATGDGREGSVHIISHQRDTS